MGLTWLALGDSITRGSGASVLSNAYIYQTRKLLKQNGFPHYLIDAGIGGIRSDEVLAKYKGFGGRCDPDIVTIMIGTNDLTQTVTIATYKANLSAIIDDVRSRQSFGKCKIILCSMPYRNDVLTSQVPTWVQAVSDTAVAKGVDYVNTNSAYGDPSFMFDTLHPNDTGHLAIANILFTKLSGLSVWNDVPKR